MHWPFFVKIGNTNHLLLCLAESVELEIILTCNTFQHKNMLSFLEQIGLVVNGILPGSQFGQKVMLVLFPSQGYFLSRQCKAFHRQQNLKAGNKKGKHNISFYRIRLIESGAGQSHFLIRVSFCIQSSSCRKKETYFTFYAFISQFKFHINPGLS